MKTIGTCKDCKWWESTPIGNGLCENLNATRSVCDDGLSVERIGSPAYTGPDFTSGAMKFRKAEKE